MEHLADDIYSFLADVSHKFHPRQPVTAGNVSVPGPSKLPHDFQNVPGRAYVFACDVDETLARRAANRHYRSPSSSVSRSSTFDSISKQSTQDTLPSTVPSRRSQLPPNIVDMLVERTFVDDRLRLPCEFLIYDACEQTFALDDTIGWMHHIIDDHLRNRLPNKSVCWFCDDFSMYADEGSNDKRANFLDRLDHISDHIKAERCGVHQIRPDYHFLDHLHHHGLISNRMYQKARSWDGESPAPKISGIFSDDFVSEEQRRSMERSELKEVSEPRRSRHSTKLRSPYFRMNQTLE